ncbi:MAG TPA: response regulator [Elusimicrobiota bacterium]|nr:response regulator [Elusimicrobiota bacterium]
MRSGTEKRRILAIDDDPAVRRILDQALSERYDVRILDSGAELSRVLPHFRPELIILDVGLPWINGFDLCEDFRQNQAFASTPILFLTGFVDAEHRERGVQAGANSYLTKPFDMETLSRELNRLFQPA